MRDHGSWHVHGAPADDDVLPESLQTAIDDAQAILERARSARHPFVVVLGNPAYYGRFGFVRAALHELRYEHPAPEPAFQVVELAPGALAGRRGLVRYHAAFSSV